MALGDSQSSSFRRFVMGTVQLGLNYGIANRSGRPSEEQAHDLVQSALAQGLNRFDTAAAYGDSELALGRAFTALGAQEQVNVVSKGSLTSSDGETLIARVNRSLERLCIPRLQAWLLHDEKELPSWNGSTHDQAQTLRAEQRVGAFGISVYHPAPAVAAVEKHGFTAVQFPTSPFDRRFLRNDVLSRLSSTGAQLYIRSVYLQGLCLMEPAQVPAHIVRGQEAVRTLAEFCHRHGIERDHFCLHYVLQRTAAAGASVVIGVERLDQLNRNAAMLAASPIPSTLLDEWDSLWPEDIDDLVLPFRWNSK